MDDYAQPEYVDGQFLRQQDFIDEQRYHLDRERRLARVAHAPGVVEGLEVTAVPNAPKVTVAAGTALDGHGRLLVRADAGDPLDLTTLVDRDGPVPVVVTLAYDAVEADAPQGGASPRWREAPDVTAYREGDPHLPAEDDAPRLARVVLQPDGTVAVDPGGRTLSGLAVRGSLAVDGPAALPGGVDGGPDAPLRVRRGLEVTGAGDARAGLVVTGPLGEGDDAWAFGTAARTSVVLGRTAGAGDQAGDEEQVSLQLQGTSRTLGILTRDRGSDPAVTITQAGAVGVATDQPGATLDVAGDLAVRGTAVFGELGQWSVQVIGPRRFQTILITIAPGSRHNRIVLRRRTDLIGPFQVIIPPGTEGQWFGQYTCYDPNLGQLGQTVPLSQGVPLGGAGNLIALQAGASPYVLIAEVDQVTVVD
jgi:hypothetical protein